MWAAAPAEGPGAAAAESSAGREQLQNPALPSGKGMLSWDLLRCRPLLFSRGCGINSFLMHKPDLNAKQLCAANTCDNNNCLFDGKIMVAGKEHFVSKQTKHL